MDSSQRQRRRLCEAAMLKQIGLCAFVSVSVETDSGVHYSGLMAPNL